MVWILVEKRVTIEVIGSVGRADHWLQLGSFALVVVLLDVALLVVALLVVVLLVH